MRQKVRFVGILIVLIVVLNVFPINGTLAQDAEDPIVRIDTMFNNLVERQTFSGSVLVARDGEILLSEGYGMAVREWDVPNTADTKYRIASLTKQFTAMAIVLLKERGLLTLDDPICMYFEECPEAWEDITIYHLLTHTSGIVDIYNISNSIQYIQSMTLSTSPEGLIEQFINEPLDFTPGERWSYSNSGYIVLGYILEEVSGDSYQTFLRENFFQPLGMENTDIDNNRTIIEHHAQGYNSRFARANYYHTSHDFGAGSLYSTVEDLYIWDQALYGGQIISEESWETMLGSRVLIPNTGSDEIYYGYGLAIEGDLEHPLMSHNGGTAGYTSTMWHYTDGNVTIIILSNLESAEPWSYAQIVSQILFD